MIGQAAPAGVRQPALARNHPQPRCDWPGGLRTVGRRNLKLGFERDRVGGGRRSARRRTDLLQPELWRPRGTVLQSRLMVRSWRVRRAEPASIQAGRKVAEPAHGSAPREPKPSEKLLRAGLAG